MEIVSLVYESGKTKHHLQVREASTHHFFSSSLLRPMGHLSKCQSNCSKYNVNDSSTKCKSKKANTSNSQLHQIWTLNLTLTIFFCLLWEMSLDLNLNVIGSLDISVVYKEKQAQDATDVLRCYYVDYKLNHR